MKFFTHQKFIKKYMYCFLTLSIMILEV